MSDLIDRMAKAAFDCMQGNYAVSTAAPLGLTRMVWEDEAEVLRDEWRKSIRAALVEARDAPAEVLEVGASFFYDSNVKEAGIGWCAMIDKALEP